MPRLTGAELRDQFQTSPKVISHMLGGMMRGFGYPNATDEAVEKELNAQLVGAEACNLNYGLWIKTYLRDGVD